MLVKPSGIGILNQKAACGRAEGRSPVLARQEPARESRRTFALLAKARFASGLADGAMTTSVKIFRISRAVSSSKAPFKATIPPNALTGSQANAFL